MSEKIQVTDSPTASPSGNRTKSGIPFDTIHIQVFEAKDLVSPRKDGYIDALCTISNTLNKQEFKTKVLKKNNSPEWKAHFRIFTTEDEGTINIKIWNSEGFFSKNQLIGELVLNVKEFSHGSEIVNWYILNDQNGKETGSIKVAIHCTEEQKYPFPKGKKLKDFYNILNIIGKGTFSEVCLAVSKADGNKYAIKSVDKSNISKKELGYVSREIEILKRLDHPHVIKLFNIFQTYNHIYMVLEYAPGGELFDAITRRGKFSEWDAMVIVRQILTALQYIHENGVAHRDLKPENLLLMNEDVSDAQFFIKVADFGLANNLEASKFSTFCGTPDYAAPEIVMHHPYHFGVDVWSLGVITYILMCGYAPFRGENPMILFQKIQTADYSFPEEEWQNSTEEAKDFIRKMLVVDPDKRATPEQLLVDPWITGWTEQQEERNMGSFNAKKFKEYTLTYKKSTRRATILQK